MFYFSTGVLSCQQEFFPAQASKRPSLWRFFLQGEGKCDTISYKYKEKGGRAVIGEGLVRRLVPHSEQVDDPMVRRRYGALSGGVGIFLNLLLSAGKFTAGLLTGSIAMTADAFNNLTDAGSSVVTLVGFRLAGRKADKGHPFGHGRLEYLSGLLISVLILLVALELMKSAVTTIFHPSLIEFSWVSVGVLSASILVKLWMWRFNRNLSRRTHSAALAATAADSLSDCAATATVLVGTVVGSLTGLRLDGYLGLGVALFIARTGIIAAKETLDPLLGQTPDPALVKRIQDTVLESPEIVGLHDLVIHDYGPGRVIATLHAEVPMDADVLAAHDAIDQVERLLREQCQVEAVIHMDPIATEDETVNRLRRQMAQLVREIYPSLTIHDFRMTGGPLHTNLIFDVELPYDCPLSPAELTEEISRRVSAMDGRYFAVVSVDRPFVGEA